MNKNTYALIKCNGSFVDGTFIFDGTISDPITIFENDYLQMSFEFSDENQKTVKLEELENIKLRTQI